MAKSEGKLKVARVKARKEKTAKGKTSKTSSRSSSISDLPHGRFHFLDLSEVSSLQVSGEQTDAKKRKSKKNSKGSLPDLRSGTPSFPKKDLYKSSKQHLKDASRYYLNPAEINSIKMTGLVYRAGKSCAWAPEYASLQTDQRKLLSTELIDMVYAVILNDKDLKDAWWDCSVEAAWPSDESVIKATVKAYLLTHCLRMNVEKINKEAVENRIRQAVLKKGVKLSELTNSNVIGEFNVSRETAINPRIVNTNQALETEISDLRSKYPLSSPIFPDYAVTKVTHTNLSDNNDLIEVTGDVFRNGRFTRWQDVLTDEQSHEGDTLRSDISYCVNQALNTAICFRNVHGQTNTTCLERGKHEGVTATVLYRMITKEISKQCVSPTSLQFLELVRNLLIRFMLQLSGLRINGILYKNGKPCTWRGRNGTFFSWSRIKLERELCEMIDKAIETDEKLCGIFITSCIENLEPTPSGHIKANIILLVNDSSLARNLPDLKVPLHTAIASYGLKPKPVKTYRLISVDEVKRKFFNLAYRITMPYMFFPVHSFRRILKVRPQKLYVLTWCWKRR